jgi:hypothetical protein
MGIKKAFSDYIKDVDYFGQEFKLTFQGRPKFSTLLGGVATIMFTIFCLFAIGWYIAEFSDTENPRVINSDIEMSDSWKVSPLDYDLNVAILFTATEDAIPVPLKFLPKYGMITGFHIVRNRYIDPVL